MKIELNPFEVPSQSLRTLAHFFNCLAADREGKPLDYAGAVTVTTTVGVAALKTAGESVEQIPPPPPLAANPGNAPDAPGASTQSQTSTTGANAPQGFKGAELDTNGLPWDARIHSGSKGKNQDGSWKSLRNVDKTIVPGIEAELRAQVAGAATTSDIPPPPPIVVTGVTPGETTVSDLTPPPPPPVPEPAAGQVTMQEVFSRANKTPVEQRNQALELVGLASMTEFLKGVKTRPELADELNAALAAISGDE